MALTSKQDEDKRYDAFLEAMDTLMRRQGVSKQQLADEVGYSRQQIADVMKRKSRASEKLRKLVAEAFHYSLADFESYGKVVLAGEDVSEAFPHLASIRRLISGLDADGNLIIEESGSNAFIQREYLETLGVEAGSLNAFIARDDSLAPKVGRRDTAFVDLSDQAIQSGGVYLVRVGEELTLRVLESIPNGLRVSATQPNISPIQVEGKDVPGFKVYGRVIFVYPAPATL